MIFDKPSCGLKHSLSFILKMVALNLMSFSQMDSLFDCSFCLCEFEYSELILCFYSITTPSFKKVNQLLNTQALDIKHKKTNICSIIIYPLKPSLYLIFILVHLIKKSSSSHGGLLSVKTNSNNFIWSIVNLLRKAEIELPEDVKSALIRAEIIEENQVAKSQLQAILKNIEIAKNHGIPMCQDTGIMIFFVELGTEFHPGFDLEVAIREAVILATAEIPLVPMP